MVNIHFYNDNVSSCTQAYNILTNVKEVNGKTVYYKKKHEVDIITSLLRHWGFLNTSPQIHIDYKCGNQEIYISTSRLDVYQDPFPLLFSRASAKESAIYIESYNDDETDIVIELLKAVIYKIPTEAYKDIKLYLFRMYVSESLEEVKEEIMTKKAEGNITVDVAYCNNSKKFSADDARDSAQSLVDLLKKAKIPNLSEVVLANYFRVNKDDNATMRAVLCVRAEQIWDVRPLRKYLEENKEILKPLMLDGYHLKLPEKEQKYYYVYWPD